MIPNYKSRESEEAHVFKVEEIISHHRFPFTPTRIGRAVNVIKLSYLQFNVPLLLAAVACSYFVFVSCKIPTGIIKLLSVPRVIASRSDVTRKHGIHQFYTFLLLKSYLVTSIAKAEKYFEKALIYCII